jgi:hypothetical protein
VELRVVVASKAADVEISPHEFNSSITDTGQPKPPDACGGGKKAKK